MHLNHQQKEYRSLAQRLGQTDKLFFIVTGSNKQNAVQQWRDNEQIPAAQIHPETGVVDVFLDSLAANQ